MPKVAADKPAKEAKTKRAPTPYQLFVKVCGCCESSMVTSLGRMLMPAPQEQMPIWKEKNPTKKHTDAMKDVRDSFILGVGHRANRRRRGNFDVPRGPRRPARSELDADYI